MCKDSLLYLTAETIRDPARWTSLGIAVPGYDSAEVARETRMAPKWLHFGAGNIFRGFIAPLQHKLLNTGRSRTGIVAAEAFDEEITEKIYRPHDNLCLLVVMETSGKLDKELIASISESIVAKPEIPEQWSRLREIFGHPSLQMVSFTITEKGYGLRDLAGDYLPDVKADVENGPSKPTNIIGKVASLLATRFRAGRAPIALVSMDNCSRNGETLHNSVEQIARAWVERKLVDGGLLEYVNDPKRVSFPWTMIDKITPRPSAAIKESLDKLGLGGMDIVRTRKGTYISLFVNTERPEYLVVEDSFPNGREPIEHAGVIFTTRESVEKAEKMKVSTCLNPLHTALAVFGCLLNHRSIADAMTNPSLRSLVVNIGNEGMPVVAHPGIIDPKAFLNEVIGVRLSNAYIDDTPQRIATDTSQKIAVRYGQTIKAYEQLDGLSSSSLTFIPLVIAGWLRYLLEVDDEGRKMPLSPDPMIPQLQAHLSGIEFEKPDSIGTKLDAILSNTRLFGVDLVRVGLAEKIKLHLAKMIEGRGAVQKELDRLRT